MEVGLCAHLVRTTGVDRDQNQTTIGRIAKTGAYLDIYTYIYRNLGIKYLYIKRSLKYSQYLEFTMLKLPFSSPGDVEVGPCQPLNYNSFIDLRRPHSVPSPSELNYFFSTACDFYGTQLDSSPRFSNFHQESETDDDFQIHGFPFPRNPSPDTTVQCDLTSPRELQLVVDSSGRAVMYESSPPYETDQYLNLGSTGQTISSIDITALDSPYYTSNSSDSSTSIYGEKIHWIEENNSTKLETLASLSVAPRDIFRSPINYCANKSSPEFSDEFIDICSNLVSDSDEYYFSFGPLSKKLCHDSTDLTLFDHSGAEISSSNWISSNESQLHNISDCEDGSARESFSADIDAIDPTDLHLPPTVSEPESTGDRTESEDISMNEIEPDPHLLDSSSSILAKPKETALTEPTEPAAPNMKKRKRDQQASPGEYNADTSSRLYQVRNLLKKYRTTNNSIKKVLCCGVVYSNALELADHCDTMHDRTFRQKHQCCEPYCLYSIFGFNQKQELTRHIRSAHSPPRYYCDTCFTNGGERAFSRSDALKRHIKLAHRNDK